MNQVYIVIDENDGEPIAAFEFKVHALEYQDRKSQYYPETKIVELVINKV